MHAKDVIRYALGMSRSVLTTYLEDLDDADLLRRSVPQANHIAWQLGHLIASERQMIAALGHDMPELPAGFAEAHSADNSGCDEAAKFCTKAEYLGLLEKIRQATLAALDATPDEVLGNPSPERLRQLAPTVGAVFALMAAHELMHAGQFVPVRRMLGKQIRI